MQRTEHATGSARKGMAQVARALDTSTDSPKGTPMIYSHTPPARVPLRPTANGLDARTLTDWPCGWTHFIEPAADWTTNPAARADALYAYRLAVYAVEFLYPEAVDHLAHLRKMRDIFAESAAWSAERNISWPVRSRAHAVDTTSAEHVRLPMHGPVAEPWNAYAERADRLREDARALLARADRIDERVNPDTPLNLDLGPIVRFRGFTVDRIEISPAIPSDGTWVIYAPREDLIIAEEFGSASAASRWADENVNIIPPSLYEN